MTFAQAQFGNHLAGSNAGGARGHPISTAESPPENPLIHPRLGLSHDQDFQFQNRLRINQLTGRAEPFQGAQPESPEEFWGRRKLPSRGWSGPGRHRPAALDRGGGCFLRGAAWGGECFPPDSSLRRLSARTHGAGSPTRGQRDAGSPARLDRGHFRSLPHTAGAGTRRADRSQQIWQRQLEKRGTVPRQHRRSRGKLGRGRKRKQPLVTHTEVARK